MVTREKIFHDINHIEEKINYLIDKEKYNDALALIAVCANVLYQTNVCYQQENFEEKLQVIAGKINLNTFSEDDKNRLNDDVVLFYDGFGYNNRGLIRNYLQALCKVKKVCYVTSIAHKECIPSIIEELNKSNSQIVFLSRDKNQTNIKAINQLNEVIKQIMPKHMFFYGFPNDVIGTTIMYAYRNCLQRYYIDMVDHTFWLGSRCMDKCIEFRDYGVTISKNYRKIDAKKIVKIPFYPFIEGNQEFLGVPFDDTEKKIIFSGGSLYKTFSDDNKYYKIVEHILNTYTDTIFWYAGVGDDTELKKLIQKFPQRVFFTSERPDLTQVLEHSRFYLSTYPMAGGLMFQYAALSGRVPVTLKHNNDNQGFLINQEHIDVEFENEQDLFSEVEKLINDDNYFSLRETEMKKAVISPDEFDEKVKQLFSSNEQELKDINCINVEAEEFQNIFVNNLTKTNYNKLFIKYNIELGLKYYPIKTMLGVICVSGSKIINKIGSLIKRGSRCK